MKTKVNNVSSVMEARNHFKKRGASENPKSRVNFLILFAIAFGFALGACTLEPEAEPVLGSDMEREGKQPVSGIVWNGASDVAVAVNIGATASDRKNASGAKITSNAHSADFPGIYFIWDSKQKDHGYLKVSADVFDVYNGFILTAKMTNEYWDFRIEVQYGQKMTSDGCYVFFIPKLLEKDSKGKLFNINMVFIGGWDKIETTVIKDPPPFISNPGGCVSTYTLVSGRANNGDVIVDPKNGWRMPGESRDIKTQWSQTIRGAYTTDWDAMMSITYPVKKGLVTIDQPAQWVWDQPESWWTGFSGSNIVIYSTNFDIDGDIVEGTIPFYFACDNAAVIFVNNKEVGRTEASLAGKPSPPITGFTDFSKEAFDGSVWAHLYKVDIFDELKQGKNEIRIVAANSDDNNGAWNVDNNPAGLIYACQFSVGKDCPPVVEPDPPFEVDVVVNQLQSSLTPTVVVKITGGSFTLASTPTGSIQWDHAGDAWSEPLTISLRSDADWYQFGQTYPQFRYTVVPGGTGQFKINYEGKIYSYSFDLVNINKWASEGGGEIVFLGVE